MTRTYDTHTHMYRHMTHISHTHDIHHTHHTHDTHTDPNTQGTHIDTRLYASQELSRALKSSFEMKRDSCAALR